MGKDLTKIIKSHIYWKAEGPARMKLCEAPCMGFANMARYNKGLEYSPVLFFVKNGYGFQFIDEQDSINMLEFYIGRGEKYIKSRIKMWADFEKKTFAVAKILDKIELADLSDKELWNLYDNFHENLIETWCLPMFVEGNGIYFEKALIPKICKETGLTEPEAANAAAVLTAPEKPAFAKKEYISLLKTALGLKSVDQHRKDFYWVRNNYKHVAKITKEEFEKEVEDLKKEKSIEQLGQELAEAQDVKKLKQKKAQELKKLKISKKLKDEIKNYAICGWWHDERKRVNLQSLHYINIFYNEIARRMGLSFQLFNNVSNQEVKDFLLHGKKPSSKKLQEREELMLYALYGNNKFDIFSGKKAQTYFEQVKKATLRESGQSNQLKGYVACNGGKNKILGKINLVLDVKNDKFEKGAILVTSMTRPEFVPVMKQAMAVITNEGGLTCHAAIVSRELNIPCIIGTKVATDMFKSGDLVEMDLEKGIIKKYE